MNKPSRYTNLKQDLIAARESETDPERKALLRRTLSFIEEAATHARGLANLFATERRS